MAKPPVKNNPNTSNNESGETDPFIAEVSKRVRSLVDKDQAGAVITQITSLYAEKFSGPIAHPRHLREYEDIVPG